MATEITPKSDDRLFCVKVGRVKRENLYEMTRKYWVAKLERASLATHVLAVINGIVEAVYIPTRWYYSDVKGMEHRLEFEGKEDINSEYIGKSIVEFYGKSQNPIKYINM